MVRETALGYDLLYDGIAIGVALVSTMYSIVLFEFKFSLLTTVVIWMNIFWLITTITTFQWLYYDGWVQVIATQISDFAPMFAFILFIIQLILRFNVFFQGYPFKGWKFVYYFHHVALLVFTLTYIFDCIIQFPVDEKGTYMYVKYNVSITLINNIIVIGSFFVLIALTLNSICIIYRLRYGTVTGKSHNYFYYRRICILILDILCIFVYCTFTWINFQNNLTIGNILQSFSFFICNLFLWGY